MFKYFIALLVGLMSMTALAIQPPITLTENNYVLLRGEINGELVANTMVKLALLKTDNPILFIQSPGGEITAGLQLMQYMKDSGRKFTCIADMAGSMAFIILQGCDNRYVLSNSLIMQHLASFQVAGPTENFKTRYLSVLSIVDELEIMQAKRVGKSLEQFKKDRLSDLWLFGQQGITYGAADDIVPVRCDSKLWTGTTKESIAILIFKITITWSNCPLVRSPLSADMGGAINSAEGQKVYEDIMLMWTDFPKAVNIMKNKMFK